MKICSFSVIVIPPALKMTVFGAGATGTTTGVPNTLRTAFSMMVKPTPLSTFSPVTVDSE